MNTRSLLSSARIARRRRRLAARRWVAIDTAAAALLTVAAVAYVTSRPTPPEPVAPAADLTQLNAKLNGLRQQVTTLAANLKSSEDLADRPDFGRLLATLADALGEQTVLVSLDATPASPADLSPRRLTITGLGRSQAGVTRFVLRVEAMKLFAKVTLDQTTPQTTPAGEGVGFVLVCVLPEGAV